MKGTDSMASQEEQKHNEMFFVSPREDCFYEIRNSLEIIHKQNGDKGILSEKTIPLFVKADFCIKSECTPGCKACQFSTFLLFKNEIKELRKIHGYGNIFIVFKVNELGIADVDHTL